MLVFTSGIQKKTITVIWRKIDKKNLSKEKLKIKTTLREIQVQRVFSLNGQFRFSVKKIYEKVQRCTEREFDDNPVITILFIKPRLA